MLIDKNYRILMQVLRYEAASTIYGAHTLLAYQQQYARLTKVAISMFVVVLVELTNTVFVNSTNITKRRPSCLGLQ